MTDRQKQRALRMYFEEGLSAEEIAKKLHAGRAAVSEALADEGLLEPFRREMEAARLRAQLVLSGSAENAARVQTALLEEDGAARQKAAKEILDRTGVKGQPQEGGGIRIVMSGGEITLGMPEGV